MGGVGWVTGSRRSAKLDILVFLGGRGEQCGTQTIEISKKKMRANRDPDHWPWKVFKGWLGGSKAFLDT